ncbi:hypothetical protein [Bacteroides reticulotermitis]
MDTISEKDKLIASLRKQLQQTMQKCSALELENALLTYELEQLKRGSSLK